MLAVRGTPLRLGPAGAVGRGPRPGRWWPTGRWPLRAWSFAGDVIPTRLVKHQQALRAAGNGPPGPARTESSARRVVPMGVAARVNGGSTHRLFGLWGAFWGRGFAECARLWVGLLVASYFVFAARRTSQGLSRQSAGWGLRASRSTEAVAAGTPWARPGPGRLRLLFWTASTSSACTRPDGLAGPGLGQAGRGEQWRGHGEALLGLSIQGQSPQAMLWQCSAAAPEPAPPPARIEQG